MTKALWLVLPLALGGVMLGAQMRAHTSPSVPAPSVRAQAEVPVTSSLATVDVTGSRTGRFGGAGAVLSFEYRVTSSRDPQTGLPTGKRQHMPVVFTRHIDSATPQYFNALATNETLPTVVFHFHHTSPDGRAIEYYTVKLTNASISDFHQSTMTTEKDSNTDKMETESVSLTFQKIEITAAGNTAADDWGSGGV